jgi:8-oxo-dGTP pyrophosphatase MutT (NUDIX family)
VQPGGHADGEENVLNVALREAGEETGLSKLKHSATVFDIDIHTIPQRKDFPEHLHYDIRFLMEGDELEEIKVSEESHDVQWISLSSLEKFTMERSVLRMRDKMLLARPV